MIEKLRGHNRNGMPAHDEMRKGAMMPGRAQEFGEWWKAHSLRLEAEVDHLQAERDGDRRVR